MHALTHTESTIAISGRPRVNPCRVVSGGFPCRIYRVVLCHVFSVSCRVASKSFSVSACSCRVVAVVVPDRVVSCRKVGFDAYKGP